MERARGFDLADGEAGFQPSSSERRRWAQVIAGSSCGWVQQLFAQRPGVGLKARVVDQDVVAGQDEPRRPCGRPRRWTSEFISRVRCR